MDKRIYIKDWLAIKPYERQTITDGYYLRICNEVKRAIATSEYLIVFQKYLSNKDIDLLSCFLTSYFEDLISQTNIWNSFVRAHQRLYNKKLPFYVLDNDDDYFEDEINPQDISILIWYFLNTVQKEKFITPLNSFIMDTADNVMEVFEVAWEDAPENEYLKSFYQIGEKEEDFYIARNLIDTVLFKTYLFYPDTYLKLKETEIEMLEKMDDPDNLVAFLNENRDSTLHKSHTRLLSFSGKEWVAEILTDKHPLSKEFLETSPKILGYFLYKGQDNNNVYLEHIASGKRFDLTKKSFDYYKTLKEVDTILFMGIVRWKNEWWFSGIHFQNKYNQKLVTDEKKSLESRKAVSFLDAENIKTRELINNQLAAFLDFNKGSQIAFLPVGRIDEFVQEFMEFFNKSLNLSEEEYRAADERAKNKGFLDSKDDLDDILGDSETGLVFYNPNGGIEIALDINSAFPLPSNPYFKEEESEKDVMQLLMDDSLSTELVYYCLDNCKTKLPFFTDGLGKIHLDDIDFLLRFWKKKNYHSLPAISYII